MSTVWTCPVTRSTPAAAAIHTTGHRSIALAADVTDDAAMTLGKA